MYNRQPLSEEREESEGEEGGEEFVTKYALLKDCMKRRWLPFFLSHRRHSVCFHGQPTLFLRGEPGLNFQHGAIESFQLLRALSGNYQSHEVCLHVPLQKTTFNYSSNWRSGITF